jgi:hypothetical protein
VAKEKAVKIVLPAGVAAYAWLTKADEGQQYSDGKFKVTVVFDSDTDLSAVEAACLAAAKAKWPSVKPADVTLPFQDGDNKEKEEFHGKTLVTLKSKFKPAQVDAKKNPLPANVFAASGDLIKTAATLYCYEKAEKVKDAKGKIANVTIHGVSLQLNAVQLLDKRNMGANSADAFDEEDGYEAETTTTTGTDEAGSDADF